MLAQNAHFFVVYFRPDNYEYSQLWQSGRPFSATLVYSRIEPLMKQCKNGLKSKLWMLIIVTGDCNVVTGNEEFTRNCGEAAQKSKLTEYDINVMMTSAEYLVLTRWLIPSDTRIDKMSKLLCFVVYADFTNVPLNYRSCGRRQQIQPGISVQPQMNYLSVANLGNELLVSGMEKELQQFLNLTAYLRRNVDRTELSRSIRLREIDLGIGTYRVTFERFEQVTVTSAISMSRTDFMTKTRHSQPLGSFGILRVFNVEVWICVLITMAIFFMLLSLTGHSNVALAVFAAQLQLSFKVRSRHFGPTMFANGLLVSCAFSSGLLSSLSTYRSVQISTIRDLLAMLRKSDSFVCIANHSFLVDNIENPGTSAVLQAFERKRNEGKLILSSVKDCLKQTELSYEMVSVQTFQHTNPYVGELFVGDEAIYTSISAMPVTPGHPLMRQINEFVDRLRETHVAAKELNRKLFNETNRSSRSLIKSKRVKSLTLRDVGLPLIILTHSWIFGCLIELYTKLFRFS